MSNYLTGDLSMLCMSSKILNDSKLLALVWAGEYSVESTANVSDIIDMKVDVRLPSKAFFLQKLFMAREVRIVWCTIFTFAFLLCYSVYKLTRTCNSVDGNRQLSHFSVGLRSLSADSQRVCCIVIESRHDVSSIRFLILSQVSQSNWTNAWLIPP